MHRIIKRWCSTNAYIFSEIIFKNNLKASDKSYWLGYISATANTIDEELRIPFKCSDLDHMKQLQLALQVPQTAERDKCNAIYSIPCQPLMQNLIKLDNHFIRGYFDGVGYIWYEKNLKVYRLTYRGTLERLRNLQLYINTHCTVSAKGFIIKENTNRLTFYGRKCSIGILEWMYEGSSNETRLERNYVLYQHLKVYKREKKEDRNNAQLQLLIQQDLRPLNSCKYEKCNRTQKTRINSKSCNNNFFKEWTPTMSYWLGFLFADGCVKENPKVVYLSAKCTDFRQIAKFATVIESDFKVGLSSNCGGFSNNCFAYQSIYSEAMFEDLNTLGCKPRKSLTLSWPNSLPPALENHFVRGYFDGDGCAHYHKAYKGFGISFAGTHEFMNSIQACIKTNVENAKKGCVYKIKNSTINSLSYTGNASPMAIGEWMYKNSTPDTRLDRKFQLYEKFKSVSKLLVNERSEIMENFLGSYEWKKYLICDRCDCPQKKENQKPKKNTN